MAIPLTAWLRILHPWPAAARLLPIALLWAAVFVNEGHADGDEPIALLAPDNCPQRLLDALAVEVGARHYRLVPNTASRSPDENVQVPTVGVELEIREETASETPTTLVRWRNRSDGSSREVRLEGAMADLDPRTFAIAAGSILDRLPVPPGHGVMDTHPGNSHGHVHRPEAVPDAPPIGAGTEDLAASDISSTAAARGPADEPSPWFVSLRLGSQIRLLNGGAKFDLPVTLGVGALVAPHVRLELSSTFRIKLQGTQSSSLEAARLTFGWDTRLAIGRLSTGAGVAIILDNSQLSFGAGVHAMLAWPVLPSILLGPRVYVGYETSVQTLSGSEQQDYLVLEAVLGSTIRLDP